MRRGLARAVAATVLAIVCVAPALAVPVPEPEPREPLRDMSARLALRWCNQEGLVVAMRGMYGSDRYDALLAAGDAYFARCGGPPSRNVKHMMALARERLPR